MQRDPNFYYGSFINTTIKQLRTMKDDEEKGYPEGGIAPGTKWEDIPDDFECPICSAGKDMFSEA